ncbi:archaetidylserine decarboxylase [Halorhodospira halochloris]|uniref:archaetidylserine decarboxylase n=1 Tax=Halorhodospira halochloris TaxID=1052 RepID=UPI001EE7ABD4|nr:archaetidylserine decarboxylase [Halorhodospira halochloris]MCG5530793.1 archaetidylserine decarboxylase [Halorhodospira halochloris]
MTSSEPEPNPSDRLKALAMQALPTRLLSQLTNRIARIKTPWIKNTLNRFFVCLYRIDLEQAVRHDPRDYESFNDLFTRALRPQARPLSTIPNSVVSPCDGTISAIGQLSGDQLIQAKGVTYPIAELMADLYNPELANGMFVTIYLPPSDYHRIHAPLRCSLEGCQHIPGRLLTVAASAVRAIPKLYVRNERLVTTWQTPVGPMALIPIGALNVGSIETAWDHQSSPDLAQGDEVGRFNLGSTVIMILPQGTVDWNQALRATSRVLMGQSLGTINDNR